MSIKQVMIPVMSWQESVWTPDRTLEGWPQDITEMPVRYFSNSPDPDTLVFNGLGGSSKDLEDTIEFLGMHDLTAVGVDLTYLKKVPRDLDPLKSQELTNYTLLRSGVTVMNDLNFRSARYRPRNLAGPSKGGAEALLLAGLIGLDPKLRRLLYRRVGSVAAVNTIGVANKGLGIGIENVDWELEAKVKKYEFVRRMSDNIELYNDIESSLNRLPVGDVGRVTNTVMFDGSKLVIRLILNGVRVRMFSGDKDTVAPTSELLDELGDYASIVEQIPGHHASLANDIGKNQLRTAIEWAVSADTKQEVFARQLIRLKARAKSLSH